MPRLFNGSLRTLIALALVWGALVSPCGAKDAPEVAAPADATELSATAVLDVIRGGDAAAIAAHATEQGHAVWVIADRLLRMGHEAEARAYAEATEAIGTARLAAYIDARTKAGTPDKALPLFHALEAEHKAGRHKAVVEQAQAADALPNDVVRILIRRQHARSLAGLRDFRGSGDVLGGAAQDAEALGWMSQASSLWAWTGEHLLRGSQIDRANSAFERVLAIEEERQSTDVPSRVRRAKARLFMARGLRYRGDMRAGLEKLGDAPQELEAAGDVRYAAIAWGERGTLYKNLGDLQDAVKAHEKAIALCDSIGDVIPTIALRMNIAHARRHMGHLREARTSYAQCVRDAEKAGRASSVAAALRGMSTVDYELGRYPRALTLCERALAMQVKGGAPHKVAGTYSHRAFLHRALGDLAAALRDYRKSRLLYEQVGDLASAAAQAIHEAEVESIGTDHAAAFDAHMRGIPIFEKHGRFSWAVLSMLAVGEDARQRGEPGPALDMAKRALAVSEKIGAPQLLIDVLELRARTSFASTREEAEADYTRALELASTLRSLPAEAQVRSSRGRSLEAAGELEEALAEFEACAQITRRLRSPLPLVRSLTRSARVLERLGENERALAQARAALREIEEFAGGLGEDQSASVRQATADTFAVGARTAAKLKRYDDALLFLESGRAGALLESLGGRDAMRWSELPEALSKAAVAARMRVKATRYAYGRAVESGTREERRDASRALSDALDESRAVGDRMQREAKREAGLFYPRAATMGEIQDSLEESDALVLYGQFFDRMVALVLTSDDCAWINLGARAKIERTIRGFRASIVDPEVPVNLDALKKLLIEPLALDDTTTRLLISPTGQLGFVPFGAFTDRVVAMLPSGTTYTLLREFMHERGHEILAVGDPDYGNEDAGATRMYVRGSRLSQLPATREEATSIGTTVLVGGDATEAKVRATLQTQERWRSVHFACHGLVDAEHPVLSSLALTPGGDDDGFFTALEILHTNIPTDLAVLSACETGLGKIVDGEGILGITRALMYAGAPRVICSLWKVDDEATRALMTEFYKQWNAGVEGTSAADASSAPRVGPAAALRAAQATLRKIPKWSHPYYWAAWTLWGLPD